MGDRFYMKSRINLADGKVINISDVGVITFGKLTDNTRCLAFNSNIIGDSTVVLEDELESVDVEVCKEDSYEDDELDV